MSNVYQILSSMAKFDAEEKARVAAFVGPRTVGVTQCRVGHIIAFRDHMNGNRYKGKILAFGNGFNVGSCQMLVQVIWFNGQYNHNSRADRDVVNVLPEELLYIVTPENP